MKEKNRYLINYTMLLILTCFFTNISQIPFIVKKGMSSKISIIFWLISLIVLVYNKKIFISNKIVPYIICTWCLLIFVFFIELLTGNKYIKSVITYSYLVSFFIFILGFFYSKVIPIENYKNIALSYVISGIIVSVFVALEIGDIQNILTSRSYAYASKNSVSQIIVTTIILLITCIKTNKYYLKIIKGISVIGLLILILLLKSRASILSIPLVLLIILLSKSMSNNEKKYILIASIIVVTIVFINKDIFDTLINNIILGGRESDNLEDLTSGRYSMWKSFPELFSESYIMGRGYYYIESFPLAILINFGMIGSIPIFIFTLESIRWPLIRIVKCKDKNILLILLIILLLSIVYWFNGLFEELSPLGPGVKCYFLWLTFGLCIGWNDNRFNKMEVPYK